MNESERNKRMRLNRFCNKEISEINAYEATISSKKILMDSKLMSGQESKYY